MEEFKLVEEAGKALVAKNQTNQPFLDHLRVYVAQTGLRSYSLQAFNAHVALFTGSYVP